MLPSDFLDNSADKIVSLYSKLELEIIKGIAERIVNFGYANTVVKNDVLIAQEMGFTYNNIVSMVAHYSSKLEEEINNIFLEAGIETLKYDDKIYKLAGLNPLPLKQSPSLLQFITATAKRTSNNLASLTLTTALTGQQEFLNAINQAYLETSTGIKSYSQAIIDAISKVSGKGSTIKYPSGREISIESAIRTNIVTSVNQNCGTLQLMRAEELGWDLMEITAHSGARPTHADWQGKVVSLSGQEGYLSLEDIGYGTIIGFKGINCKHDWRPYYKGSSKTYTSEDLKEMKDEKVIYNGKEYTKYQASQIQRNMERTIRQDKKDIVGQQTILINSKDNKLIEEARTKLIELQTTKNIHTSIFNNFLEETGFKKDYVRLKI